jgi:hypothetical protein
MGQAVRLVRLALLVSSAVSFVVASACGSDGGSGGGTGGTSGAGSGGTAAVTPSCDTPLGECVDCLDTRCTAAYTQCEYDPVCGPERLAFATCLGQCEATPDECGATFVAAGGPKASALFDCAKGSCASAPGTCQKP